MRRRGFTLIEVLVTLVVIGIAAVALMSVFSSMIRGSADPVIQQQAVTVAEAYLEEILLQSFDDPEDPESGGAEADEPGRGAYDDVKDYRALGADLQPTDQFGASMPGLAAYRVTVLVDGTSAAADLDGIARETDALRVVVTVTHPAIAPVVLSSYRTRY